MENKQVETYVLQYKPSLVILTPCYGSMCYTNYVSCLCNTINLCKLYNIPVSFEFCRCDSLVPRARNNLLAKAMSKEPKATHFIFIDADITWDPHDILKLMISHKLVCGGLYPLKSFQFDRLLGDKDIVEKWKKQKVKQPFLQNISDTDIIQHNLLSYNFNVPNNGSNTLTVVNNMTEVRHLATGFMMLRRETIECMQKAFPSTKYVDDVNFLVGDENKHAFALFDCGVEDGHYFSEDWLFCQRWVNMGGKVYANLTINLTHTGIQDFRGSVLTSFINNED